MPKALWLLIIGMIMNVTGISFIWPMNTIYLHQHLGQPLTVAGLVLMANAGAGVIGNLVGGTLFDRIGGYKTMIIGICITVASAFILAFYHSFLYYIVLLVGIGLGSGITFPAIYALAGSVWPEGGRKAFNAMYVAQNVGVALGTALAGIVASFRFDYIFFANGIMYILFLFLVIFGFRKMGASASNQGATTNVFEQSDVLKYRKRFIALLIMCVGYLVCWIGYVQWQSTISVHTQNLGITLSQYSILWTINGAMIVLAQPIIAFFIRKWVHTLKAQIMTGLGIFICSFYIVAQAETFTIFIVAMVVLTIGEMFVWPAIPTIAHQLAPEGKAGFYQGIVNSVATGGRMIGPFLGGVLADLYGMSILFYFLMGFFLIAFITTATYDRILKNNTESGDERVMQT
ncbi:MDR family MFS transporter [Bacillus sp. FJAT-45350]|uniref:MDR family MFS transporter n=1 Tax=Bacillus sp. FJAT-45350 TaxID=2011014 RepID=UPI000BB7F83C|nr:MFS transporter [Bacillus sp. FJAT-45350]